MPYPSQFQSQGEYSTLNLNEGGTKVTQENVIDHKNNYKLVTTFLWQVVRYTFSMSSVG